MPPNDNGAIFRNHPFAKNVLLQLFKSQIFCIIKNRIIKKNKTCSLLRIKKIFHFAGFLNKVSPFK